MRAALVLVLLITLAYVWPQAAGQGADLHVGLSVSPGLLELGRLYPPFSFVANLTVENPGSEDVPVEVQARSDKDILSWRNP